MRGRWIEKGFGCDCEYLSAGLLDARDERRRLRCQHRRRRRQGQQHRMTAKIMAGMVSQSQHAAVSALSPRLREACDSCYRMAVVKLGVALCCFNGVRVTSLSRVA